jgi:hypothetical protein
MSDISNDNDFEALGAEALPGGLADIQRALQLHVIEVASAVDIAADSSTSSTLKPV